ncbi:MAG TPA: DUF4012 domain-containing protein [Sporichthyaceae bacterium]|jgi:hypothetical protein
MRMTAPLFPVRRRAARGAAAAAALAVCGAGWLGITGWAAHKDLNAVRTGVDEIRVHEQRGDMTAARTTAQQVAGHAARAHRLTGGAPWAVASRVPGLGSPLLTLRGISAAADELGSVALPNLLTAGSALDPGQNRDPGTSIDVAALQRAEPAIDAVAASLDRAAAITRDLPRSTWLGAADRARADVHSQLERMTVMAGDARETVTVLPRLLGSHGPKRYFLAFQNLAEARGTGGLPGAFAIVQAKAGRVKFLRFENDGTLAGVRAGVDLGRDYDELYGDGHPEALYLNSNLSPHFPDAARIWCSMWHRKTGQRLDGALAVDPVVLSYLLAVTGPAQLPDGSVVSADNVVALTQNTAYVKFGEDIAARKEYLLQVARAAAERVTHAHVDAVGLGRALARAASERRLLVWSADRRVQRSIARTPLAGVVPRTAAPYAGLTIINSGGNKLDYYLDRSLDWDRADCGSTVRSRVTVRLRNDVPPGMTDGYVIDRSDRRAYPTRPGDNRVMLYFAATHGAVLRSATLDGQQPLVLSGTEQGHPVFVIDVELPARQQRTIVLEFDEPQADGVPIVLQQPLVRPLQTRVREIPCATAMAEGSRR